MNTRIAIATVVGCVASLPLLGAAPVYVGGATTGQGRKPTKPPTSDFATISKLPSLGGNSVAWSVNAAGTVIVGQSYDRAGLLYGVKWTIRNGSWAITTLPYPTSATAQGIDNDGNVVGYSFAHPVLWPAGGGYVDLGCEGARANAISADGQFVVGQGGGARVWQPAGAAGCGESLPSLAAGASAVARAVNGDGRIIGGIANLSSTGPGTPTIWTGLPGQRQVHQLDARPGAVMGANAQGDLAGYATISCAVAGGCQRAFVWYANAGPFDLGTLGGVHSTAADINAAGEVVGMSSPPRGDQTAYFWTTSTGMLRLSANRSVVAFALSDTRMDGTRLVVGVDDQANAAVWVVRIP